MACRRTYTRAANEVPVEVAGRAYKGRDDVAQPHSEDDIQNDAKGHTPPEQQLGHRQGLPCGHKDERWKEEKVDDRIENLALLVVQNSLQVRSLSRVAWRRTEGGVLHGVGTT